VIAGLERNVRGRSARRGAGHRQGMCLGVRLTRAMVITFADDMTVTHDDGTDRRVWRRIADSASRKLVRTLEKKFVEVGHSHGVGLFVAATTTAPVTVPPARRIASAQSDNVAPVVHTSSTKVHARP